MTSLDFRRPPARHSNEINSSPKIKVLVCTANMGNEEPNVESISKWIPNDGATKSVLENQQYPIRANMKTKFQLAAATALSRISHNQSSSGSLNNENGDNNEDNIRDDNENEKFHIIAIGMQEATFEPTEEAKHSRLYQKLQKVTNAVEQVTKNENYQEEKTTAFGNVKGRLTSKSGEYFSTSKSTSASPLEDKEEGAKDEVEHDRGQDDTRLLHHMLGEHLPSYTRAVSYQRGQMRLMIFYNEDEINLDVLSVKAQNTGRAGLANKGGIVAECDINGGTRIAFLTAHLEAHEGLSKYNTRCSTIGDIFRGTVSTLADSYCDVSMTSHFMFAMGDLNFRTRLPNHEIGSDEHLKEAHILAEKKDWNTLNEHDELALALRDKECLVGFSTPKCHFPPTFKVERKDGYSYISKRSPSYTDRILYKANHRLSEMIDLQAYEPIDHFTTSDHKPIRGAYEIQLNQTLRWRPLLAKTHIQFRYNTRSPLFRKLKSIIKGKNDSESDTKCEAHGENFHIFLSSIGCEIAPDQYPSSVYMPSPCVSFISTPTDAMEMNNATKENWKSWYNKKSTKLGIGIDLAAPVTIGWPHTNAVSNTLNPQWKNDINFKIRTHAKCGTPVDLTGAMLHILVHDTKDNLNLIGSCSLNLASLVIASRAQKNWATESASCKRPRASAKISMAAKFANHLLRMGKKKNSSHTLKSDGTLKNNITGNVRDDEIPQSTSVNPSDKSASLVPEKIDITTDIKKDTKSIMVHDSSTKNKKLTFGLPTSNDHSGSLGKAHTTTAFSSDIKEVQSSEFWFDSESPFGEQSQRVDEILMKNGKEVGSIKFHIDTWWLNDFKFANLSTRGKSQ